MSWYIKKSRKFQCLGTYTLRRVEGSDCHNFLKFKWMRSWCSMAYSVMAGRFVYTRLFNHSFILQINQILYSNYYRIRRIRIRIRIRIIYWIVASSHSDMHTISYNKFEFKMIHSMSTFNETPIVLLISLIGIIIELIQHLG